MLFNSYEFIFLFLPITLIVFFAIGAVGSHRIAISWLVGASLFYYGWWNPAYLGLILASILFNYSIGVYLGSVGNSAVTIISKKKIIFAFGIIGNLAALSYYKYANFFVDTINTIASTSYTLEKIILPLAISFFTFQQIAYLVDAYRGETREYNFLHYCIFVCFFPQLIAGPIVHHKEMLPQFENEATYKINLDKMAIGISIFFIGLFKKVVLADNLSLYVGPVFDVPVDVGAVGFTDSWVGAMAYTFQLYFDFSGYSDMAIGIALMFGIYLPVNFNSPYKASNIIDFWRRWHITLSRFLRDYLYFSLGGNRKGKIRKYANLLITMLLGGLWHGAGWTFIVWGGLHGLYLIVNHGFIAIRKIYGGMAMDGFVWKFLARLITLFAVVVGWVFFRASDFTQATQIINAMMGVNGVGGTLYTLDLVTVLLFISSTIVVWWLPNCQVYFGKAAVLNETAVEEAKKSSKKLLKFGFNKSHAAILAGIIVIVIMFMQSVQKSEFLYYDF